MLEKYPKVQIELNLSDDLTDLLANGVDIALRVGHLADSSMVAKKIGVKGWACFASPSYLKNRTVLRHPQELSNHNCLAFQNLTQSMTCWSLTNAQEETHSIDIKPVIYSDDGRTLIELAIQALGIIYVDPLLVTKELQEGRLVEILPGWSSPAPSPINLVCLGHQARGKAVDAVWRFLSEQLPKTFK